MSDNSQIVENPLELLSLFPSGMYVFNDRPVFRYNYDGNFEKKILNIFSMDIKAHANPYLSDHLYVIMCALKLDGQLLEMNDFGVLNVKKLENPASFEEILEEFEPKKTIFWLDSWEDVHTEIRFYETGKINNFEVLRCHALLTMYQDPERKKICWEALKRFFALR